jgi:hypothetical protein
MDPARPAGSQVLALIQSTLESKSAALFDEARARSYGVGSDAEELESVARDAYLCDRNDNDIPGGGWSRVLRLGGKTIGAIALRSEDLNSEMIDAVASVAAIAISPDLELVSLIDQESERLSNLAQVRHNTERFRFF